MEIKKIMSITQIATFVILTVFVMPSAGWSTTYYIDATDGNDSNDGLSTDTEYYYRIAAYNNYDGSTMTESGYGQASATTSPDLPNAPTILLVEGSTQPDIEIVITWDWQQGSCPGR